MEPDQIQAIFEYLKNSKLFEALMPTADQFIEALHQERVISNTQKFSLKQKTDKRAKVVQIFKVLKETIDGWEKTTKFLRHKGSQLLAEQLISFAEQKRNESLAKEIEDCLSVVEESIEVISPMTEEIGRVTAPIKPTANQLSTNNPNRSSDKTVEECKLHFAPFLKDPDSFKQIDINKWKDCRIVSVTAKLAFLECTAKSGIVHSQFDEQQITEYHVSEDSIACGFLKRRFHQGKRQNVTAFHTVSVQEYFAALHCYQLMLERCCDKRDAIVQLCLMEERQVGRFLFGICSNNKDAFLAMNHRLHISFADSTLCNGDLNALIRALNFCLADCSNEEQSIVGKRLLDSVWEIPDKLVSQWARSWVAGSLIGDIDTLKSNFLGENGMDVFSMMGRMDPYKNWGLKIAQQKRQASLMVVDGPDIGQSLSQLFDKVSVLIWSSRARSIKDFSFQLGLVPPVTCLLLLVGTQYTATMQIDYYKRQDRSTLKTFRLQYNDEDITFLSDLLWNIKLTHLTSTTVGSRSEISARSWNRYVLSLNVTVTEDVSQPNLIASIIRLVLNKLSNSEIPKIA